MVSRYAERKGSVLEADGYVTGYVAPTRAWCGRHGISPQRTLANYEGHGDVPISTVPAHVQRERRCTRTRLVEQRHEHRGVRLARPVPVFVLRLSTPIR